MTEEISCDPELIARSNTSNTESLVIDRQLISIKEHLAFNKILTPISIDKYGKRAGFFKIVNGQLQIHIRIPRFDKKAAWYWFYVLDATEQEQDLNHRLNVRGEES